jgi:hypothetical protein
MVSQALQCDFAIERTRAVIGQDVVTVHARDSLVGVLGIAGRHTGGTKHITV